MIFIDAAKNPLKVSCVNFHQNLMSRGEMANISKLVRFFYQPDILQTLQPSSGYTQDYSTGEFYIEIIRKT